MESIVGLPDTDALALIDDLMRHATQLKCEYRHKWRVGDWVLWDNRSVMHQANPDYDMRERRYLYRLLLKGRDAGLMGATNNTPNINAAREDDHEPCISSDSNDRGCRQRAVGDGG